MPSSMRGTVCIMALALLACGRLRRPEHPAHGSLRRWWRSPPRVQQALLQQAPRCKVSAMMARTLLQCGQTRAGVGVALGVQPQFGRQQPPLAVLAQLGELPTEGL